MKDLVALQMTRRQPAAPCDGGKPESAAGANRKVLADPSEPGNGGTGEYRGCFSSNILVPHAGAGFLEGFLDFNI